MEKSKVYFTDLHAKGGRSLLQKLDDLMLKAGMGNIDFRNKFTAIKIHFGEEGNLAYLRSNYAKVMADFVKRRGGRPFLTDCNTLYVGHRKNGLEHLELAYEHGFNPLTTGCHVIIADGLKGTDEVRVPIGMKYVKEAKIGHAIMDADIILTLNHFKAHEMTGFGGALKNIGMGCGSRAGKMEMHSSGKPFVVKSRCVGCHSCERVCAQSAISFDEENKASIHHDRCVGCGRCLGVCPVDAVRDAHDETFDILNKKINEYCCAVLNGRPHFHVSFVMDVSPYCDCHGENDVPIVPDVGIFASADPVALDKACVDAVNRQPAMPNSVIGDLPVGKDRFQAITPATNWKVAIDHAVEVGLGSKEYELIEVK